MTPQRGDEVSEQTHEHEAVLSVQMFPWKLLTPAQVEGQGSREGGGHGGGSLSFL